MGRRRLRRFAIALSLPVWLLAPAAHAASDSAQTLVSRGPWDLTADQVEYERDGELYVARGNVRLVQGERTVTADWMSLSNTTGIAVASGDVVIRDGADTLRADFMQFDVQTLQGIVFDGRLDSETSRFRLEGDELRRLGPEAWRIESGRFTTCRCPDPGRDPWAIRAERAELEPDGDATARNTTFDVLGVPVLWVPWMTYPLRTGRKTGFLLPEFNATSRSGGDVGLPFFWAAAPNLNVTLTPSLVFRRGFMPRAAVEYVFGERSEGELFASFIHDRDVQENTAEEPFDDDRWGVDWVHDHFLPADWRFKADARAISDNLYVFDFRDLSETRAQRFLQSRGFVERHFGTNGWLGLTGGVRVADDLQSPDDLDRDRFLLQRVPEVGASALPRRLGPLPLVLGLDLEYTNFQSRDSAESELGIESVDDLFLDTGIDAIPSMQSPQERNRLGEVVAGDGSRDDFDPLTNPSGTEGDGRFQEGEPLADEGQRMLVAPRLGLPLRLADRLELYPEIGYHGTLYDSDAQGTEVRSLLTARLDLRTRLRRAFQLPFGGGAAVHLFEPRLGWAYVSDSNQGTNPLYVPGTALPQARVRQLELDNVTRDPADRIVDTNALVLALGNRILRRGAAGASALWGELTLLGAYRFDEGDFGLVVLEGTAWPLPSSRLRFNVAYDPEERHLSEALSQLAWASASGHEFFASYRYKRDFPRFFEVFPWQDRFDSRERFKRVNQLAVGARVALTPQWALTYRGSYSFNETLSIANQGGIEYISRCRCWAIRLELEEDRKRGVDFSVTYRLIGIGDDAVRPFGGRGATGAGGFLDVGGSL